MGTKLPPPSHHTGVQPGAREGPPRGPLEETSGGAAPLVDGVMYAHVSSAQAKPTVKAEDKVGDGGGLDLGDLMAQLKGIQK